MDTNLKNVAQAMIKALMDAPELAGVEDSDAEPSPVTSTPTGDVVHFNMRKGVRVGSGRFSHEVGHVMYEVTVVAKYVPEEE